MATPLGNPGDLSPRAREVLAGADLILAEDTRRAGLLCSQCNIPARRFLSFHDHNESERQEEVLRLLRQGQNLALAQQARPCWPIPATVWCAPAGPKACPSRPCPALRRR